MHFLHICALGVALLLATAADALSVHGLKHSHPHAQKHHPEKRTVAGLEALSTVSERDITNTFSIELVNNFDSAELHAYIQTTSASTGEKLLINADGEVYTPIAHSKYVATPIPKSANCGIPLGTLGSMTTITMPIHLLQGRIYLADGDLVIGALQGDSGIALQQPSFQNPNDPNFNISFGFIEVNQPDNAVWANPSYVDFVGLPLAMEVVMETVTLNVSGLPGDGVKKVCDLLQDEENKDGYPWNSNLCLKQGDGQPFRILSPEHRPDGFSRYFDEYIDQVWNHIGSNGIMFDLQNGSPLVSCHLEGDRMVCEGTSLAFSKPTSADIWGCNSGPFAQTGDNCHDHIGSRFCAAFNRATLLLPGGAVQPNLSVSKYYPGDSPHNKYARIVHQVQVDHMGYAFPYDDVRLESEQEASGTLSGNDPSVLRIYVGGHDFGDVQQPSSSYASQPLSDSLTSAATSPDSSIAIASSQSTEGSTDTPTSPPSSPQSPTMTSSSSSVSSESPFSEALSPYLVSVKPSAIHTTLSLQSIASGSAETTSLAMATKYGGPDHATFVTVIKTDIVTQIVTATTTVGATTSSL